MDAGIEPASSLGSLPAHIPRLLLSVVAIPDLDHRAIEMLIGRMHVHAFASAAADDSCATVPLELLLHRTVAIPDLDATTILVLVGRMNIQAFTGTAADGIAVARPGLLLGTVAVPDLHPGAVEMLIRGMNIKAFAGAADERFRIHSDRVAIADRFHRGNAVVPFVADIGDVAGERPGGTLVIAMFPDPHRAASGTSDGGNLIVPSIADVATIQSERYFATITVEIVVLVIEAALDGDLRPPLEPVVSLARATLH